MLNKTLFIFIGIVVLLSAIVIPCAIGSPTGGDVFQKLDPSGIWKTKYIKADKVIMKYLYITNNDGLFMYLCSYQSKDVNFVTLGIKHTTKVFTDLAPPMYKSRLCCWKDVKYFNGDEGIMLEDNSWVWMLNEKNGVTINTSIVKNIVENNEIKWRFDTIDGSKETQFTFPEHQSKTFNLLINWLLKKEK